jgi:excisionase family DNA binding protein
MTNGEGPRIVVSPPALPGIDPEHPPLSISLPEACRCLHMDRKTVRRMLRAGILRGYRAAGTRSRIRVTWDSFYAFVKGRAL